MQEQIGKTAGLIWNYLNKNGEQSLTALTKGVEADKNMFSWGLGWLAREGKIEIVKEKGKYTINLAE